MGQNSLISFLAAYGPTSDGNNMYDEFVVAAAAAAGVNPIAIPENRSDAILKDLTAEQPRSVILTGTAGDGKTYTAIRYVHKDGDVGWYDTEGKQRARPFLRNPLPFLRVTSSMGYRTHPISRKRRYHGGVDLGAPTGTPVRATASGVVERAGWNGGYGNYIKVGHSTIGPYKTAYAHLHKIKVKKGQRVKQGDVIGTVGSTGRSTGPHLHYELHVRGKKVDPFKAKLPSARTLPSSQKASFNVVRDCWMPWVEGTASEEAPRCVQPHDDKEG